MRNVLEVERLNKSFGKLHIIKDVSFEVKEGEIVGFVGPNGAGKTTTLKLISNLIFPDSGSIKIAGYDLLKEREKALSKMAGVIENPGLYLDLTGRENLEFIKDLRKVKKDKYDEIVEMIGLAERLDRKVNRYSLGMKQRLGLGMSMLTNPEFLILDEPTNGLDPTGTIELRNMIVKMSREFHTAILFSSHMLSEVEKIADRIIYIKEGQILNERENILDRQEEYFFVTDPVDRSKQILETFDYVTNIRTEKDKVIFQLRSGDISEILKKLVEENVSIKDTGKEKEHIEDVYSRIFLSQEQ